MINKNDKIGRILLQLQWLVQNRNVSMETFCAEFDLTRDEAIKNLSLLTYVGPGKYGGELVDIQYGDDEIRVIDSQGFDRPLRLNNFEVILLLLGLKQLIEVSDDPKDLKAVEKRLLSLINEEESNNDRDAHVAKNRKLLEEAIKRGKKVKFDYTNANLGSSKDRTVSPLRIYTEQNIDYLDAVTNEQGYTKSFRLERIQNIGLLDIPFSIENVKTKQSIKKSIKIITKAWNYIRIFDLGVNYEIKKDQMILDLDYYDEDFILDTILRLGLDVEIHSSNEIKDHLLSLLKKRIAQAK
jgi:predicted DNA-binding transcriptional regulator YafY